MHNPMLQLDQAQTSLNQTQQRIIEATLECLQKWGARKTSLSDIAQAAGVTRATVYSYYPNKQEVFQAAFLDVAAKFVQRLIKHYSKFAKPEERLLEGMVYICQQIPKDPLLGMITTPDMAEIVNQQALTSEEGQAVRLALMQDILLNQKHYQKHLEDISELMTRMVLSLILVASPKPRNTQNLRKFLAQWIEPVLSQYLN